MENGRSGLRQLNAQGSIVDYERLITESGSVFLDTAPIIYFIEAHEVYGPLVKQLMEIISKGWVVAYTSVITLAEVLPVPLRSQNEQLATQFTGFIKNDDILTLLPINTEIAEKSGELRAKYQSLQAFDAMQLAAAIINEAKLFITNDKRLQQINDIDVLVLKDYTS